MRKWLVGTLLCSLTFTTQAEAQSRRRVGLDRKTFFQALKRAKIIDPELVLVHFSHTCDLKVEGRTFHVLDVEQQLPDMKAPRGVNQIVILDTSLKPIQRLNFFQERPMRCKGNQLLVAGELDIPGMQPGNLLTFTNGARDFSMSKIEWEKLEPLGEGFPG